jgi:hypothetical protein
LAGSTIGSVEAAVVVGPEVDGALVDLFQQLHGHLGQPGLGVAHRRRPVAVEAAEVAVPLDQRVAQGEVLSHAHQGVVGGRVAVRVVLAQHLTDHRRALAEARVGVQVQVVVHRVQDPPLHRLQAVAHVRQRARRDDADGVVQVPALGLLGQVGVRGLHGTAAIAIAAVAAAGFLRLCHPDRLAPFSRPACPRPSLLRRFPEEDPAVFAPLSVSAT